MKAVIMAGGKGTRIASVNAAVPKPMIEIDRKPILLYQIECLAAQGITDIVLVIGYLGERIKEYFGSGDELGVNITYICEKEPLGTAGALYYLKNTVSEDFLLMNGDSIFDVDIKRFRDVHLGNDGLVTIFTHPNSHPYDSGVIIADKDGAVTRWLAKEDARKWYKNRVNAGLHMMSSRLLERFAEPKKTDLDRDVLKPLIAERNLYIYDSPEYVKDMGTPDRLHDVERDIRSGMVVRKNLLHKQKAVFLDRDGTINRYVGFLNDINDFELLDGVPQAVRRLNESGYLVIVVTNQPVIARGELTLEELDEIHNKMETLLGRESAYVDDIFYCPHHPDKGFAGERPEYKIKCTCRKPEPGMLMEAAKKYNIDLLQSWMIGDSISDIEAGRNAGCRTIYIAKDELNSETECVAMCKSLPESVEYILQKESDTTL